MDRPSVSVEELVADHRKVETGLRALERELVKAKDTGTIDVERVREVCAFSQSFVDRCHHGKEEGCLFPCLESRGLPRDGGPIAVMLEEHESGRRLVARISEGLDAYASGKADVSSLIEAGQEYHDLLTQHIMKEEAILFPLGARLMDVSDDSETAECFAGKKGAVGTDEIEHLTSRMARLAEQDRQN